jgi:glycosyltransferase involved in cell wall biosynthesis
LQPQASPSRRPLFILSVAGGYGGAERNIEILLPRILRTRRVVILAANPYHLARLWEFPPANLEIHAVDAARDSFVREAGRILIPRYLALRPSAIFANTLDSLRILSHVAGRVPEIDGLAFFCVHDFQWRDYEALLAVLPRATLLAPDRCVLEKPDYIGRFLQPDGPLRARVLPNPVDLPEAEPRPLAADAAFLHLATVNGFKGHRHLAEAAALVRKRRPAIRIASYGHRPIPELYREILRHRDDVGAVPTLALHDHVADASALLAACRAVLVTSVSDNGGPETFGRTIIEAWAQGRPVIAFAAGAPAHLVRHGTDGLLVEEKDAEGLADAIVRLHDDPARADRLGRAGRERVGREFGSEVVLRQLLALLDGD